ncbi:MAG: replicative DNA helicase [Pseudomonadota bacterium]
MDQAALKLDDREPAEAAVRTAPHNVEQEQELLGAILVNNETFDRVSDFLEPAHFFIAAHQEIYNKSGQLIRAGKVASPVTLKTFFPQDTAIAEMPVLQYLFRLVANATSIINAEDYGRAIRELAVRRNLITIGQDMVNIAYDAPIEMPPSAQIEDAERRLYELAEKGQSNTGFGTFSDALTEAIELAAAAYQRDGQLSGISTGITDLDAKLGGFQPSDLIVLAGRPGMGKSALATNIAFNMARAHRSATGSDGRPATTNGAIVGFYSLEMSSEQLATRILAEQSGVPSSDIRRGSITEDQFQKLAIASQEMQTAPLYLDQTGGISIAQLAARARRLKRQHGLDMIVVDYLQLVSGSSKRSSENRVQEITEITTSLKALAKELSVPILALSQLSRQVEAREDKRPMLSDLRESGSIEQDADVVLFVFREKYYVQAKKPAEGTEEFFKWQADMERVHNKAEVIIGKQRHGPTGTVELRFDEQITRFSSAADESRLPERFE